MKSRIKTADMIAHDKINELGKIIDNIFNIFPEVVNPAKTKNIVEDFVYTYNKQLKKGSFKLDVNKVLSCIKDRIEGKKEVPIINKSASPRILKTKTLVELYKDLIDSGVEMFTHTSNEFSFRYKKSYYDITNSLEKDNKYAWTILKNYAVVKEITSFNNDLGRELAVKWFIDNCIK